MQQSVTQSQPPPATEEQQKRPKTKKIQKADRQLIAEAMVTAEKKSRRQQEVRAQVQELNAKNQLKLELNNLALELEASDEQSSNRPQIDWETAEVTNPGTLTVEDIRKLSDEDRERLRLENAGLADYVFMKARERAKYFHAINQSYRSRMKPVGLAPNVCVRKNIRFKRKFEVRFFAKDQIPTNVATAKPKKETPKRNVHFV